MSSRPPLLLPELQARTRQVLGGRGAPIIEGIEAVQPVISLGSIADYPAAFSGEALRRPFVASASPPAVAGQGSWVQIVPAANTLLEVREIILNNTSAGSQNFIVGRAPVQVATGDGEAHYADMRLPAIELAPSLVAIQFGADAAILANTGSRQWTVPTLQAVRFEVEYMLVQNAGAFDAAGLLLVQGGNVNAGFTCSFAGYVHSFGSGVR